jgi:uracil-DNA glycosylase
MLRSILYGEAPGPRGADQSGVPFWGDGAGIPLYRALAVAGCADFADSVWERWDGAALRDAGLWPRLIRVALSNAYPCCPTDDGKRFRAPKRSELVSSENIARLRDELRAASSRGAKRVITLGRCAAQTIKPLVEECGMGLVALPHPSSQGLLMDAPGKGRGMRLEDLRAAWEKRLVAALLS